MRRRAMSRSSSHCGDRRRTSTATRTKRTKGTNTIEARHVCSSHHHFFPKNKMNDKHLATRARLILRELQIRRATFLHAWMAEYIAECLDVLEKDPTNTEVKDRCAGTIARLWQAYVEDRRQSLAQAGDVYRTRACLTDDVLAELRVELSSNADTAKAGSFESSVHSATSQHSKNRSLRCTAHLPRSGRGATKWARRTNRRATIQAWWNYSPSFEKRQR